MSGAQLRLVEAALDELDLAEDEEELLRASRKKQRRRRRIAIGGFAVLLLTVIGLVSGRALLLSRQPFVRAGDRETKLKERKTRRTEALRIYLGAPGAWWWGSIRWDHGAGSAEERRAAARGWTTLDAQSYWFRVQMGLLPPKEVDIEPPALPDGWPSVW